MSSIIGIRREDKNEWERRVPLIPDHVRELRAQAALGFRVQPSPSRVFADEEYESAGATVTEDLSACRLIIAVKEVPASLIMPEKVYLFFSHTIKGQRHSLAMLERLMSLRCSLLDYERIVNDGNQRLVAFGRHAGLAGMVDTLWALGKRLEWEALATPFASIRQASGYRDVEEAKAAVAEAGVRLRREGLPPEAAPMVFGFAGYGRVAGGAWEIMDQLPHEEIPPGRLAELSDSPRASRHCLYKVVFREEDLVEPRESGRPFVLREYYDHPERYRGRFEQYIPYLTVLVNGTYWDAPYPRLVTKAGLKNLFERQARPRLRVIGDLSCDIAGGVECNLRATDPGSPVYVYDPRDGAAHDGFDGPGVVVLAVDNLPCEFSRDASIHFSTAVKGFIGPLAAANFDGSLDACRLPSPLAKALILYRGKLTPAYEYLLRFVRQQQEVIE